MKCPECGYEVPHGPAGCIRTLWAQMRRDAWTEWQKRQTSTALATYVTLLVEHSVKRGRPIPFGE